VPLRVVQWGTGHTGSALRYILRSPALQLVGLRRVTESKEGTDAGEVAGLAPTGYPPPERAEHERRVDLDLASRSAVPRSGG
jgi:hypothetical protein